MRNTLLFCLYAIAVSAQDGKITCSVPPTELFQDAVLTCNYPEDLSVTKKDFSVNYNPHHPIPDPVIDCWWIRGNMSCSAKPGIMYQTHVNKTFTMTFTNVTSDITGTYACQVANYDPNLFQTCNLEIKTGRFTTCQITLHQNSPSQASLTCFFNEDIGALRRNFSVYKHNGQDKQRVMECQWKGERPECWVEHGFLYDYEVSTNLTLRIPEVTKEKAGNYSCWHASSDTDQMETCYLDSAAIKTRDQSFQTLAIGLSVGLTVLAALVAVAVFLFLKYKGKFLCLHRQSRKEQDGEEALSMLENNETDHVTKAFQEQLVKEISAMYPNMQETSYFVPPVYFNRTRYRPQTLAGQTVFVSDTPDPNHVRHDRAMQHVIHCVRHMAESQEERMFVLTQFQYKDYLNSPDPAYRHHRLPTPAGLREADSDVGCFDFLIVHRLHGLLVGVVKAVSDRDVESHDKELKVCHVIVQEVTEAVKQLEKAKRVIQHLMSDQENVPNVRKTLIFPNLSGLSLRGAVKEHNTLVENLRECLGANAVDDPTELCLCAEKLSNSNTPWDVSHTVINNMLGCWKWNVTHAEDAILSDELYLNIIARFFGPPTQSTLQVPEGYEHFSLPKILPEAVSLIGDLFTRLVMSPDLIKLLDEPRVVLIGPPNSGKTTLLSLAGGKWLSSGHDVFVIKDKSSKNASVLLQHLKTLTKTNTHKASVLPFAPIYEEEWSFSSIKSIGKFIKKILKRKAGNVLCILIDEAGLDRQGAKVCCDSLLKRDPGAHLWITCVNSNNDPDLVYERHLTEVLSSPPSVLREVTKGELDSPRYASESIIYPPATDGLAVKHINDKRSKIPGKQTPTECGRQVGKFLSETFLIVEKEEVAKDPPRHEGEKEESMAGTLENPSASQTTGGSLHFRDILIVFFLQTRRPTRPQRRL